MEENIRKRGVKRSKEAILADYDARIAKHEELITAAEEKHKKTVAYHMACIEALKSKREATENTKRRTPAAAELLKKIKESGKTIEDVLAMLEA